MKNEKRAIADIEGLASNEEDVEDLQALEKIEEILRATYERKTRDLGSRIEGKNPV
jgi:hypothetical protein